MGPGSVFLLLVLQDGLADTLRREEWKAVRSLIAGGDASRPGLAEAARSDNPDVAFYARAALAELARPRLRTDGLDVLFKTAGLPFGPDRLPDGLTLAEAVEAASRALKLEIVPDEKGIWKAEGTFLDVPRFASGSMRARVEETSRGTSWKPGLSPQVAIWVEGRLEGFGRFERSPLYAWLRVLDARDEHGRDLRRRPEWDDVGLEVPLDASGPQGRFGASLEAPDLKTTRIARLRMAADFCFQKRVETLVFKDIIDAQGARKRAGDVEATIKRARMEGGRFFLEMELEAPGIEARVIPEREALLVSELNSFLADAEGRLWEKEGGGSGSSGRSYSFRGEYVRRGEAGPPAIFSFSVVAEVETDSLYVELKDLKLP